MKIGIDARMYGTGFTGIGRYVSALLSNLAKIDTKNDYVVFLRPEGLKAYKPPSARFTLVLADFPHYSFSEQIGFLKLLNSMALDLMHFTHFNAPIFYKKPFVVTIHDLTVSFFPGKKMTSIFSRLAYNLVIRQVVKNAKVIAAVSANTKKDLIQVLGVPEEKIHVIYNGVDPLFGGVTPVARTVLLPKLAIDRPFFLYTGVWRDHKNVAGMIRAFAAFNEKTGKQHQLVITGRPNPNYPEIPDTIRELKIEKDVSLVGLVSDAELLGLYQNALAYVFPSFYEGFGLPPLEAMQVGTPVIASNTSAIPEVCGEGSALFFNPYDLKDMEDKMHTIARDSVIRETLREKGLERVKAFSWEDTANKILELYNSVSHG
jgi:glycosyltransferase involved in cell wall biosynthesis